MIVLDTSALLAFLNREPGWDIVAAHLPEASVSTANVAEVLPRYADLGGDAERLGAEIDRLGCEVVPVSMGHALVAAKLWPLTRAAGLSLGDRLCLALASERACPVFTSDRTWTKTAVGVPVRLTR